MTREARTMSRLTRAARGAALAAALALVVAAPAAAVQPTTTVIHRTTDHFGADESGCGFAVTRVFDDKSRLTIKDFSSGVEVLLRHETITITNDGTGASTVVQTFAREADWYDAGADVYRGVVSGRWIFAFYPGDMGPDGQIIPDGEGFGLLFTGRGYYTWDDNVGHITEFRYEGIYSDVCAALS
jgi:hypothetical protein